jgi:hypothetical protein
MERQAKDGTFYKLVGTDEWSPVTREAKDGTIYKKVGPDEWSPLQVKQESIAETAVMQGLQGFTGAQFLDEASGGVEAAGRVVGLKGLGGSFSDIGIAEGGPTLSKNDLIKSYQVGRDRKREILNKQSSDNPGTSAFFNIAGGIFSPVNKVTKGMSAAKAGLTIGGLAGFGASEADNIGDMALDTAKGAAIGGGIGKGIGYIAGKIAPASSQIAEKIEPAIAKKNVDEIIASANKLGIKVTPGMLDDTGFVERLESSLSKSPSLMGRALAKKLREVNEKLMNASSSFTDDATSMSKNEIGEAFKSGVTAKVGERLAPISQVFDEVSQSTKFIPISDKSKQALIRNIEGIDSYKLTGGSGKPSQYVEMISRLENADQVKTAMTMLNADIRAAQGAEKQVLIAIKDKLGRLEENSITRAAIKQAREAGMRTSTGKQIGLGIVNDLRDARTGYRALSNDLGELAENTRIKTQKGPAAFLDEIESLKNEDIQAKFFNVKNLRSINNLKEKFPEQFELLKQGKLSDLRKASINNQEGEISTQKFLNEMRKLEPEVKRILFKNPALIDDIERIQQSLPRNFNPSGTASEVGWSEAIQRNIKDIPQYLLYKGASTNLGKKVAGKVNLETVNALRDVTSSATKKITSPTAMLSGESLATKAITKGPDKWVLDGAQKVSLHNESFGQEKIEELKKTQKGRDLLMRASDLKPGSKAMENLIKELERSASKGGE